MDLIVGDQVKVVCVDVASNNLSNKVFVGKIISIFNACDLIGDNWFIEIKNNMGAWFLYKPRIDNGTIERI